MQRGRIFSVVSLDHLCGILDPMLASPHMEGRSRDTTAPSSTPSDISLGKARRQELMTSTLDNLQLLLSAPVTTRWVGCRSHRRPIAYIPGLFLAHVIIFKTLNGVPNGLRGETSAGGRKRHSLLADLHSRGAEGFDDVSVANTSGLVQRCFPPTISLI